MLGEARRNRLPARTRPKSASDSPRPLVAVALAFGILVALGSPQPVPAQTFQEASFGALEEIGAKGWAEGLLKKILDGNTPSGVVSAAPSTTTQQAGTGAAIERRLQTVRESEERRRESGAGRAIYASYLGEASEKDDRRLHLPRPGGASTEILVGPAQGLSLFVNAGASVLDHHENRFEGGYTAHLPTVTVGADYLVTPRLLAGVAFNYTRVDGTYDDGGGFDKNIFNPALYTLFLPFDGAFVSAIVGYARGENSNDRKVVIPLQNATFIGNTSGDYTEHGYSAEFLAGYDHPIGSFTVGPRLGLAVRHSRIEAFRETGYSGFELRYSDFDQTSVQSSLGAAATAAIRIPNGVLLPQASVAWVHEYANDERDVRARFIHASPSPTFTFKRERPARDWANIVLGVSAAFVSGWQPFVQVSTIQGNKNFVSYGGIAGLRFSF
jgi:outer membrane autotransporter protein